jgi:hypothetical protein
VKRYGPSTRGSGGRNRPEGERLREHEVEDEPGHERVEEDAPARHLLAEDEVEPVAGVRDPDGRDEHGDQDGVLPAPAGRLAVAAHPVAGERVEERPDAERVQRGDVDEEAAEETGDRSGDGAAQQAERDDGQEEQVGGAGAEVDRPDERHLQERRDEDEQRDERALGDAHGRSGTGRRDTRTKTASRLSKSTSDSTSTCCQRSVLSVPTEVTRPIGIPFG